MDAPVILAPSRLNSLALALSPRRALAVIVVGGMAARFALVLGRDLQRYLPDEYLYGQLARSLAEGKGARVLGLPGQTPALLQPLITAPAWLANDPATAFRITQAINVVAMGLGAVVVYVIARHLGVGEWKAVASSAVAISSPDLLYTGYVTADAIGSTLALVAILAGVRALEAPSFRRQSLFLATVTLATAARLQYAAIAIAAVVAAVLVERGRAATVVRRHALVVGLPITAIGAIVVGGGLGRYGSVASFSPSVDALIWVPVSAALLALASGVVIVPGAVAWTVAQCLHPTARARVAFAGLTAALLVLLLIASALFATETDSSRFFERYLMLGIPLAAIAFCTWTEDGRPLGGVALGVAAILLLASTRVPISGYAAGQGRADSPFLLAVGSAEDVLGVGAASLVIALLVAGCVGLAVAAALGRVGAVVVLGFTAALLTVVSVGAHSADRRLSEQVSATTLSSIPDWVDRAGADNALLVAPFGNDPTTAMLLALRNRSLDQIALLGRRATPFDGAQRRLGVDEQGHLRLEGRAVRGWLLLDATSTRVVLARAHARASHDGFSLVLTQGTAQLAGTVEGLGAGGNLAHKSSMTLYATGREGTCRRASLRLRAPRSDSPVRVTFGRSTIDLAPGASSTLELQGAPFAKTTVAFTRSVLGTTSGPRPVGPLRAWLTTTVGRCKSGTG